MKSTSRPYQFTLRTLLLVVIIAAVGSSWYPVRRGRIARQEAAMEPFRKYVSHVLWDNNNYVVSMFLRPTYDARDEELANLRQFVHLRDLDLEFCKVRSDVAVQ
jgi:hypothetical protein